MPILEKASVRRRRPVGDFLAVLLLAAVVGGGIWHWWHSREAQKTSKRKAPAAAVSPAPAVKAKPKPELKPIVIAPQSAADFPRPARDGFEAQVALARPAISPGSLDAASGSQTRAALAAFQRGQKISESAALDTNTRPLLTLAAPLLASMTGATFAGVVTRHVNWTNMVAGTVLKIPDADYPEPAEKAAFTVIHLSGKYLEAFGAGTNLLLHCPCSIAAKVEKRPVGELHVAVVAPKPNYTVNPELFPESAELQGIGHKLILQPGPNNPVGVAWIGLDRPGYGMHGTPVPEQVGRTESHGCFRLANWDAEYLVKLVWVGMPVEVVP